VENFADIFFDYNEPVRTNTTLNRIYDVPAQVVEAVRLDPQAIIASPLISSFSPAAGKWGSTLTLSGRNFFPTPADNLVQVNGVAAEVLQASPTSLVIKIPAASSTGKVKVQTRDGVGQSQDALVVYQPPTLAGFSPEEAKAGEKLTVTLTGTHFAGDLSQDTVWFGGVVARVLTASQTQLTVELPREATTGPVLIGTPGGRIASPQPFVVWQQPVLTEPQSRGRQGRDGPHADGAAFRAQPRPQHRQDRGGAMRRWSRPRPRGWWCGCRPGPNPGRWRCGRREGW
jgi:hypothetical protein